MRLNQVTVPSKNVKQSIVFYTTLGLQLIVDASPKYARFALPEGDSTFSIHAVKDIPEESKTSIYFENENLDALVDALQEKGMQFTMFPTDQPWLWREARLLDPDGNKLILYTAGKNRKNPPWRIN
ncbi:VOC family protein [Tenacibaculum sp. SG-28]|uniref:VOC family protein n=1 Tax=Tenacibaculum sp. SG-28 TaxID=754426 RepID=UPI000CF408DA|nr:VOC family protein [Tenacibaculum sp. SG-28]PQJ22832.1 bleomycin resistance protein [Tenacibaculum sp. SG-28]